MSVIWHCLPTGSLMSGIPAVQPSYWVRKQFNVDFIPNMNDPFFENNGKDTLSGHNTVPNFFSDRTILMTFLPNLCNLQQAPSNRNLCSYWKFRQSDAFCKDVFCKRASGKIRKDFLHAFHAFCCKQTDLPVSVARMRISENSPVLLYFHTIHRILGCSPLLTDAQRNN